MKKAAPLILIFIAFARFGYAASLAGTIQDTSEVKRLNTRGFNMRLTNPDQTVSNAAKALQLAKKIDYTAGIAESFRVLGIGHYYLNQSVKAIDDYLTALNYFTQIKDVRGQGRVYNNIGNLYRDNDYDLALEYFQKALAIATKLSDKKLIAPIYLNMGNIYYRKMSFNQALTYDNKSTVLYAALNDSANLVQCMQNTGLVYFSLNQYDKAESLLLKANEHAKQLDLNEPVASIDLTLAELYTAQNKFPEAKKIVQEGLAYSKIIKDGKLESDFKYTNYQLELKRKDYKQALFYLRDIYKQDSIVYKRGTSTQINMFREQVRQEARQKENEILLERQAYDRGKFWAVVIVAGLLLVLVALLFSNVKRKAKTNQKLTALNGEVSRQKDNLDRINHHLEEIIDERTKDLQIKNKKLSEYSSYLSHQIRGPIATLKGLLNLEKEGLVDQPECIKMMDKCVSEIDSKIIEMSDMLHDPGRSGF